LPPARDPDDRHLGTRGQDELLVSAAAERVDVRVFEDQEGVGYLLVQPRPDQRLLEGVRALVFDISQVDYRELLSHLDQ
jgi:hypothetical protein